MRGGLLLCATSLLFHCSVLAAELPAGEPGAGISRALAHWRAEHYRAVRYDLRFDLARSRDRVHGEVEIAITVPAATELVLDWRPAHTPDARGALTGPPVINGVVVEPIEARDEHLVIPRHLLRAGENRVVLRFESPVGVAGAAITRFRDGSDGEEYLYTLFVPADASTLFPCLDQPDLKARFALSLRTPAAWEAVANMPQRARHDENGMTELAFEPTPPISTYAFAFAAGPFAVLRDEASGTRLFVRRSRVERAQAESAELFRLNRDGLHYLADWFDAPFPFPKYDLVLIPEFAYAGMEHAGATFLREDSVLFPFVPSEADRLRRALLIFHEATHQWFGDLVTMRWFDDLWLKEGFANLMAYKAAAALVSEHDAWNAFRALKVSAYRTDVTQGTTPIWQALPNLSAAKSAYGSIVYSKAPAVLRQAEAYLGDHAFQAGVRAFLRRHAWDAARWDELIAAFEQASGRDLRPWAHAWVQRAGLPHIALQIETGDDGRIARLALVQIDASGPVWPQAVELVLIDGDGGHERFALRIEDRVTEVTQAIGRPMPRLAFANHSDLGYALFALDAGTRRALLADFGGVRDPLLRAQLWDGLWEAVRAGELAPAQWVELCLRELPGEHDELTTGTLLADLQTAMRRYLRDAQRAALEPAVEARLREGMLAGPSLSLRIAYFRAFAALARSAAARDDLVRLLAGELSVPGLELRLGERYRLLRALLAQADPRAEPLLAAEAASNVGDDGRRFAWAAEAARPDAATKQRYFDAFLRDPTVAERWIEEAVPPFNTVEHERLTLGYLEPALRALPEVKRTRRIFFVNNWLAAFIGGQRSAAALATVERFLRDISLDTDLRRKVLEAMDELVRTVAIRGEGG
jgi:aminopeptidase N